MFSWLRKRGVRKILEIVVIDSEESSHSDESIQNALEGFEVEIWDWRRSDITSSVIASSSSVVKDLTLYFSGNETILEDWCGSGGFANEILFPEVGMPMSLVILRNSSRNDANQATSTL